MSPLQAPSCNELDDRELETITGGGWLITMPSIGLSPIAFVIGIAVGLIDEVTD